MTKEQMIYKIYQLSKHDQVFTTNEGNDYVVMIKKRSYEPDLRVTWDNGKTYQIYVKPSLKEIKEIFNQTMKEVK